MVDVHPDTAWGEQAELVDEDPQFERQAEEGEDLLPVELHDDQSGGGGSVVVEGESWVVDWMVVDKSLQEAVKRKLWSGTCRQGDVGRKKKRGEREKEEDIKMGRVVGEGCGRHQGKGQGKGMRCTDWE